MAPFGCYISLNETRLLYFCRLLVGYILHPNGEMDNVSWSDFEFFNHGEDGNPPKEMVLKFSAGMIKEFQCMNN